MASPLSISAAAQRAKEAMVRPTVQPKPATPATPMQPQLNNPMQPPTGDRFQNYQNRIRQMAANRLAR